MVENMELRYSSTRNNGEKVKASEAILRGLATDGGLYVPDFIPHLDKTINELVNMSYKEVAYEVMKLFFNDFTKEELMYCIDKAYDDKFDVKDIAQVVRADGNYYLELFHGKTIAFKDMALSILPYLLTTSAKKNNVKNDIVILTATSGDTGKAALEGFADVENTKIIVFYPKNGVSPIQEKQMVTQKGANTHVIGIEGNFDDAQNGVKKMFNNKKLAKELEKNGYQFSSANSINIGRLVPQIVYYIYSYALLVGAEEIKNGEVINVVVPTGNFGNILAAYYAKRMGLPIAKLICASNENKVLYDFFNEGTYDKNREFILTKSPSMDILISSNLERMIYSLVGRDDVKTKELMEQLTKKGKYSIDDNEKMKLSDFVGKYATEEQTSEIIKYVYDKSEYLIDTHTAVAAYAAYEYKRETLDEHPMMIVSTASPYKFTRSVMNSLDLSYDKMTDFELVDEMKKVSEVDIPNAIEEIRKAKVLHKTVCGKNDMEKVVKDILNIK